MKIAHINLKDISKEALLASYLSYHHFANKKMVLRLSYKSACNDKVNDSDLMKTWMKMKLIDNSVDLLSQIGKNQWQECLKMFEA